MSAPAELLDVALGAARAAAGLVREHAERGVGVAATKSSVSDPVTEADRASEALVRRILAERRPDDAILGEEGDDVAGTSGVRWIVDPIDGTVNFLYGLREYAVSVAAEVDGEVVAGVVLNVATGTEYTAALDGDGSGVARRDGIPIRVRETAPLAQRLVGTGFSYDAGQREIQARAMLRLLPKVRDIRRMGSCSLDLCHVAEGSFDAYIEEGVNLWDYAAGGLVARLAGAVTELAPGAGGRPALICAPADGYDAFRAAVQEAGFLI